ncbi:NAD(P)-binding domain-containing protein [Paenibacillus sp. AR247]|uniref:NAD(P)-binding domain-containing protein n=1 Tax=Paenibacillus sp. AR247 TaxID=1631599 RepID=UPI002157FD61|nr:NAD(P)-binding domain-containing protein [Paenibacillus sp. AR247]
MMNETIGFIGLGSLGMPLANNLLDAGYPLVVHNRTASKAEPLIAQGARLASRPDEAVAAGGIVVTILWDDASVESIVMSDGFLEKLGKGGIRYLNEHDRSPGGRGSTSALHPRGWAAAG